MLKNFSVHSVFPLFESGSRVAQAGPELTLRMTFSPYSEDDLNSYSKDDLSSYSEDDPELTLHLTSHRFLSLPINKLRHSSLPHSATAIGLLGTAAMPHGKSLATSSSVLSLPPPPPR